LSDQPEYGAEVSARQEMEAIRDMIRLLLRDLKAAGRIECLGRGPGAKWRKRVIPLKVGKKEGNEIRR